MFDICWLYQMNTALNGKLGDVAIVAPQLLSPITVVKNLFL